MTGEISLARAYAVLGDKRQARIWLKRVRAKLGAASPGELDAAIVNPAGVSWPTLLLGIVKAQKRTRTSAAAEAIRVRWATEIDMEALVLGITTRIVRDRGRLFSGKAAAARAILEEVNSTREDFARKPVSVSRLRRLVPLQVIEPKQKSKIV